MSPYLDSISSVVVHQRVLRAFPTFILTVGLSWSSDCVHDLLRKLIRQPLQGVLWRSSVVTQR